MRQVQEDFPDVGWTTFLKQLWTVTTLALILERLCQDLEVVATLPLNPFLGAPEGYAIQAQERQLLNPQLNITISPRRVGSEAGKGGNIIK